MTEDQELRRNWRIKWLDSIREFADGEAQTRLWLDRTNANPHFSFIEYFCCYFDDLGLSDNGYQLALGHGFVSADETGAVAKFHAAAAAYEPTDGYDHDAILADPKWDEVVAAARHAQVALLNLLRDPRERELLTGP